MGAPKSLGVDHVVCGLTLGTLLRLTSFVSGVQSLVWERKINSVGWKSLRDPSVSGLESLAGEWYSSISVAASKGSPRWNLSVDPSDGSCGIPDLWGWTLS